MNKDFLTVNDLCDELGIGKNTAYKLIKEKKIKSAKFGRRHLIHCDEVKRYISETMIFGDN